MRRVYRRASTYQGKQYHPIIRLHAVHQLGARIDTSGNGTCCERGENHTDCQRSASSGREVWPMPTTFGSDKMKVRIRHGRVRNTRSVVSVCAPEAGRGEQGSNVAEGPRVHGPLCTETSKVTHISPGVQVAPRKAMWYCAACHCERGIGRGRRKGWGYKRFLSGSPSNGYVSLDYRDRPIVKILSHVQLLLRIGGPTLRQELGPVGAEREARKSKQGRQINK